MFRKILNLSFGTLLAVSAMAETPAIAGEARCCAKTADCCATKCCDKECCKDKCCEKCTDCCKAGGCKK